MTDNRFPGSPDFPSGPPEFPGPGSPGWPGLPPSVPGTPNAPDPGPVPPTRTWVDPQTALQEKLYERLLSQRIVLASGILDDEAANRLSAQLLTLDAEGDGPIRVELVNLRADLSAALTVMGVLDTIRAPVNAYAGGETAEAAIGVLACCPHRTAYPNAVFMLEEPRMRFGGTAAAMAAREQQVRRMTDSLYYRIAEATGHDADDVREDARRGRTFTVAEALGYGLIHERAAKPDRQLPET